MVEAIHIRNCTMSIVSICEAYAMHVPLFMRRLVSSLTSYRPNVAVCFYDNFGLIFKCSEDKTTNANGIENSSLSTTHC